MRVEREQNTYYDIAANAVMTTVKFATATTGAAAAGVATAGGVMLSSVYVQIVLNDSTRRGLFAVTDRLFSNVVSRAAPLFAVAGGLYVGYRVGKAIYNELEG